MKQPQKLIYSPRRAEMKKEIEEEKNMSGAVLLITISFSIPAFSHNGTRTKPPPIATVAPSTPARKPLNIPRQAFLWVILSLQFQNTQPRVPSRFICRFDCLLCVCRISKNIASEGREVQMTLYRIFADQLQSQMFCLLEAVQLQSCMYKFCPRMQVCPRSQKYSKCALRLKSRRLFHRRFTLLLECFI